MSCSARRLLGRLCAAIVRNRHGVMGVLGGLALAVSTLTGIIQNPRSSEVTLALQRQALHDRVQRVRDALGQAEVTPVERAIGARLAQWFNWGNWSNGWNNYRR